jgi:hypothetical protein
MGNFLICILCHASLGCSNKGGWYELDMQQEQKRKELHAEFW